MPDIVTTQIFQDGEKGITATKMNNIIADATIQPSFYSSKPSSATLDPTDQLLELKGSGAYAQITGSQLVSSVSSQVDATPQIYSVRLRSFNAIGNPNFEVAQRNSGASLTNPASGTFLEDRWWLQGGTSLTGWTAQRLSSGLTAGAGFALPGTNFIITTGYVRFSVTTPTASLAAGQILSLIQNAEGPQFRELSNDVHSVSIFARSSIANFSFGLFIRDPGGTRSLTKLCTLGAANQQMLITLPNLPVFPSAGNFSMGAGVAGYVLGVCLACGSTNMSPANDTWQNGSFAGAVGQGNLMATSGATFDVFFIQHEPGSQCTTLMDLPFDQNLLASQRCYQKTYNYGTAVGTVTQIGACVFQNPVATTTMVCSPQFKRTMAKAPTVVGFSPSTGASGNIRDYTANVDRAISAYYTVSESNYGGLGLATSPAASSNLQWHYTADTGW